MDLNEQAGLTLKDVALAIMYRDPARLRANDCAVDVYKDHAYAVKMGVAAMLGLPWVGPGEIPNTYSAKLKNGGHPKRVPADAWIYLDDDLRPAGWDQEAAFRGVYKLTDKTLDQLFSVGTPTLTVQKAATLLDMAAAATSPLAAKQRLLYAAKTEVDRLLAEVIDLRNAQTARNAIRRNLRSAPSKDVVKMLKKVTIEDVIAAFEADED